MEISTNHTEGVPLGKDDIELGEFGVKHCSPNTMLKAEKW